MTPQRKAAANNRAHDGTTQAVRDVLRRATEPLSCDRIAQLAGLKPEKVKGALAMLITVTGGVVSSKGPRGILYTPYRPPERTETSRQIAGRITIPGYRYPYTRERQA